MSAKLKSKKNKPVLSVSILSSGHEPHIEDCLKGIVALRDELDMELVVVDTSPEKSGEVRDLILSYADQVVDFDWCDDFAAARNAGLRKCTGEWFMFVDDDEVLVDVEELVRFFKSGEYRKCNTASIIIRNLLGDGDNRYSDNWVPRMYVRPDNSRFVGRVHERFTPCIYPYKGLHVIAEHYGYIFKTRQDFEKHLNRNMKLILQELEDHPDDIVMRIQLLQEYYRKRDFKKQIETADECIRRLKGKRERSDVIFRGISQGIRLRAFRLLKYYDKAVKLLEELKKRKSYVPVARAFFSQEGARLYDDMAKIAAIPEEEAELLALSRKEAEEYIAVYDKIGDSLSAHGEELAYYMANTFDEENMDDMKGILEGKRPPERLHVQLLIDGEDEDNVLSLPFMEWVDQINTFLDASTSEQINQRNISLRRGKKTEDIRFDYFDMRTDEKMLRAFVRAHDGELPGSFADLKNAYGAFRERLSGMADKVPTFFEKYKESEEAANLTELAGLQELAGHIKDVLAIDEMDAGAVLSGIRDAMGLYPPFDAVLSYYTHLYGEYMKQGGVEEFEAQRAEAANQAARSEMKQIIETLQKKVDELVSAGMIEEADALLKEIRKYTP